MTSASNHLFAERVDRDNSSVAIKENRRGSGSQTRTRSSASAGNAGLRMCVLGSGSGGNSTVVQLGRSAILIDAGLSPAASIKRLQQAGVGLEAVAAVCLTHLDQDHFRPAWVKVLRQRNVRLYVHHWHVDDLKKVPGAEGLYEQGLVNSFDSQSFRIDSDDGGLEALPIHLPHDRKGTIGFLLSCSSGRIGYATDLGRVPAELIDHFSVQGGVDLLAIESNYDPMMQQTSSRPAFLKQRITGGRGHLSNEQAYAAVKQIMARSDGDRPGKVVLLHRSSHCNCPTIVQRVFAQDPAIGRRVVLAQQRRRSRWLSAATSRSAVSKQMAFGF